MFDIILIIKTVGLIGIFLIIFAESGLFFGFFLPGDSLLFTAGLLASTGVFDIYSLLVGCIVAAIAGDSVGYFMGKKMGRAIFDRDQGFFFKKSRVRSAEAFYRKHGVSTIIMARFIPIIRTFAPIVAGISYMKYSLFVVYNTIGAIVWVTLLVFLGYFLGNFIPNPDSYILPIIIGIIIISLLPILIKITKVRVR